MGEEIRSVANANPLSVVVGIGREHSSMIAIWKLAAARWYGVNQVNMPR